MNLNIKRATISTREITFGKFKSMNSDEFRSSLDFSRISETASIQNVHQKAVHFNECIQYVLDQVVPIQTKTIKDRPGNVWFNEEIREAKRGRNRAERKWRQTGLVDHREIYHAAKVGVTRLIENSKASYYRQNRN
ncbi:hypothetical protein SNE40_005399 [Patella caerulea]|uniref:Uncharacterized protein n=1 Tax=Patella caerulea TaxID=87958 RepID=A0AAN8K2K1_PATCE